MSELDEAIEGVRTELAKVRRELAALDAESVAPREAEIRQELSRLAEQRKHDEARSKKLEEHLYGLKGKLAERQAKLQST